MRFLTTRVTRRPRVISTTRERHRGIYVLAWTSMFVALGLLIAAIVLVPRGIGALFSGVSESRPTSAEVLEGTVLIQPPATATWQSMDDQTYLAEGTRLRTDDRARAFLRTPDSSTVLLYNNTELGVQRMQFGRFNPSLQDSVLRLFGGRVQIGVALHPMSPKRRISVLAGEGRVSLGEGSYQIDIDSEGMIHVSVKRGNASVWSGNRVLEIPAGLRAILNPTSEIVGPLPTERDLLQDPLLEQDLADSPWSAFVVTEAGAQGTATKTSEGIRFKRMTQDGRTDRHGESGIVQELDRDIRGYSNLRLRADVRVDFQSLSGGGTAGTEYPLMLRLTYIDANRREQIWATGFYYQNDSGLSVMMGREIPPASWITFENPTLLQEIRPTPVHLRRIEVLGSGWEYLSEVRRVELTGY